MNPPSLLLPLLLLIILILSCHTTAQPQTPPEFILKSCSDDAGNYTDGSPYQRNLNTLLFSSLTADNRTTTGPPPGPDRVNAIALCRGDVPLDDCRRCLAAAARRILVDCPVQKQAFGYSDYCQIGYSNRSMYGSPVPDPPTFHRTNGKNVTDPVRFDAALGVLLTRLRDSAAGGSSVRKFAAGTEREQQGFVTIYGLAQCSPDLSRQLCGGCLTGVGNRLIGGRVGARIWQPGCQLRYETYLFYNETESPSPSPLLFAPPPSAPEGKLLCLILGGGNKNASKILMATVIPVVGAATLGFIVIFFCRRRRLKGSRIRNQSHRDASEAADEISNEEFLQFDFATMRAATKDFADESKLGEGGFGVVYKGILSNEQEVAVKRLGRDSRQGDIEFKNEVKLVAKLQHRNLVRLLGFCLEGEERLLVYEFVPNASLDHFLFDANRQMNLNWERRYKIIEAITRGMVYLHEDSRLRIIHRDLKASNILLDAEMNPKISDFGMARLFDMDETQGKTNRIVGTYGYMAPEYAMHGQFSAKSDVFSFGVLVLEIVSGHQNCYVHSGSTIESLISYVYKNWRNGTYTNLVDPSLGTRPGAEVARCIHIGLLCVQENINDRPTMAAVALMLCSHSVTLPLPSKPAFFLHTGNSNSTGGGSSSSGEAHSFSRNEVSLSEFYPR
ncbi:unnamed protein product [Linum tenue]|uniref:Uncharacterized protein n=2 Tax=Linum tenue TaxID=586396 RepID=A0AAV0JB54_9ROSI|nr:unnamed protein product [Linum tenue]